MRKIEVAVALVVLALAVACGTGDEDSETGVSANELIAQAESTCQVYADCEGKDNAWINACVEEAERQITAAEGYGCLDIMAVWFTCLDDNSICTIDKDDADEEDPDKDYTDEGACSDQEDLAEDCRDGRL